MADGVIKKINNLDKIFYPGSVAIVGTNNVKGTVPYDILKSILDGSYKGKIYPVSPREKLIEGIKAYKYVIDIEEAIDLAIIVFPSSVCHLALEQCARKDIRSVIIISAGFRETGGVGIEREENIKRIAGKNQISLIGPNCLGVINTDPVVSLNASFARRMPEEGVIAFLSQSGALCTAVLDYAQSKHIGFSKFISIGNKADVNENDLLHYLMEDDKTKVILLYLEDISDGRALMQAAREAIEKRGKPILIIKSGRTSEGAEAAASHTGSLAGSDIICDSAFKQAGIIRCDNIEQMFNRAIALAYQPLPVSNKLAIITNAGGPGVLTTDAVILNDLKLAKFTERTTAHLKKKLPSNSNINNPVDLIGDARAERYKEALETVFTDDEVDGVLVILTPQSMTEIELIAKEISKVPGNYNKPVYASFMGEADVAPGIEILQLNRIPHYTIPESMADAFACAYNFSHRRSFKTNRLGTLSGIDNKEAGKIIDKAMESEKGYLPESMAYQLLSTYGIPVVQSQLAKTKEEAVQIAKNIGFPVVMKIASENIIHKSDVEGVILNINNDNEVREAFDSILFNVKKHNSTAVIQGIHVSSMIKEGEEVILGMKRDSSFGPVIMFGMGGIFVEVFEDVSFRVAPVNYDEAYEMIRETKAWLILSGYRGGKLRDVKKIEECIFRLSKLVDEHPEIDELDINPLIVLDEGKGCFAADARIKLRQVESKK